MARRYNKLREKKPLIVICSEGDKKSSEFIYFQNFSSRDLRIQFSTGSSTDPKGMVEDLIKYIHKEDIKSEDNVRIFLVLDTDLDVKRINEIKEIEKICKENNIEIITSSPTFEIWYLMHYRKNKLKFRTSHDVKKELNNILGKYKETMNIYNLIKNKTEDARKLSKYYEKQSVKDQEDILNYNPHTSIYKILDAIDDFNLKEKIRIKIQKNETVTNCNHLKKIYKFTYFNR